MRCVVHRFGPWQDVDTAITSTTYDGFALHRVERIKQARRCRRCNIVKARTS